MSEWFVIFYKHYTSPMFMVASVKAYLESLMCEVVVWSVNVQSSSLSPTSGIGLSWESIYNQESNSIQKT